MIKPYDLYAIPERDLEMRWFTFYGVFAACAVTILSGCSTSEEIFAMEETIKVLKDVEQELEKKSSSSLSEKSYSKSGG